MLHGLRLTHCSKDIGLFVELDAERVKIGVIHEHGGFRILGDAAGAFRKIDLPDSQWLLLEKNATLVVDASELGACRQEPPSF